MIYITNETNVIQIPRHSNKTSDKYRLEITNQMTRQTYSVVIQDVIPLSYTYQILINKLTDIYDGDYSYTLYIDNESIEIGLLNYQSVEDDQVVQFESDIKKIQYTYE